MHSHHPSDWYNEWLLIARVLVLQLQDVQMAVILEAAYKRCKAVSPHDAEGCLWGVGLSFDLPFFEWGITENGK
jgi:hypothetical protein